MNRTRNLVVAAATAALSISALVAPVAAEPVGDATVVFVNGVPGKHLEVCVDGSEVRSFLRYKKAARRIVTGGLVEVEFRRAAPGKCKGPLHSSTTMELDPFGHYTVVASKGLKKTVVVDNTESFGPSVDEGPGFWGVVHAAMAPRVLMLWSYPYPLPPFGPVASEFSWGKGDAFAIPAPPGFIMRVRAIRDRDGKPLTRRSTTVIRSGRFTQQILVGANGHFDWAVVNTPAPFLR